MKRCEMIKDKKRFNYIIKHGHYNKDKRFVIYDFPSIDQKFSQFGIAISNSVGHAVVRNRLKRQTRAIIDENKNLFKNGKDYIIMIRNGCLGERFEDMNSSIQNLLKGIK